MGFFDTISEFFGASNKTDDTPSDKKGGPIKGGRTARDITREGVQTGATIQGGRRTKDIDATTQQQRQTDNFGSGSNKEPGASSTDRLGLSQSVRDKLPSVEGIQDKAQQAFNNIAGNGTPTPLAIKINSDNAAGLLDNVLNDYINVQYHISLSMIPLREAINIQAKIPQKNDNDETIDDLRQELKRVGAVVFASTGEEFRNDQVTTTISGLQSGNFSSSNINRTLEFVPEAARAVLDSLNRQEDSAEVVTNVGDRNYYNITDVEMETFYEPSKSNPNVSQMATMKMTIVEPHGFKLHEDIKNSAKRLGYVDINVGRVVYRIDIRFSGYNPNTGQWVQNIPINARSGRGKPFITYYTIISKIEADVTSKGVQYELSLVPSGSNLFRGDDFSVDAGNIFTKKISTFGGFLDRLEEVLRQKTIEETKEVSKSSSQIRKNYKFYAPAAIREAPFYSSRFANEKGFINEDRKEGQIVHVGRNTDMMTLIKNVLSDLPDIQDLFIARAFDGDNAEFTKPRIHFTSRFNAIYGSSASQEIGDLKEITYEIIIEPFITFKKIGFTGNTVNKLVSPIAQKKRIAEMIKLGMIIRKYDYINTSENTEVIDFGIRLSNFYYETMASNMNQMATLGTLTSETTGAIATRRNTTAEGSKLQVQIVGAPDNLRSTSAALGFDSSQLNNFQNTDMDNEEGGSGHANSRGGFDSMGVSLETSPDVNTTNSITSEADEGKRHNLYMNELQDYFANELLLIEDLQVRGDPVWLLSPYGNTALDVIDPIAENFRGRTNIIRPNTAKYIYLNIKASDQNDLLNPNRVAGSTEPNVIGGFYGVIKVTSTFSGGKFIQKLVAHKLAHLNYVEDHIRLDSARNTNRSEKILQNPQKNEPHENTLGDSFGSAKRLVEANLKSANAIGGGGNATEPAVSTVKNFVKGQRG